MSSEIDKIISGIPDSDMKAGYAKQRASLAEQLAINAAGYRLAEKNDEMSKAEKVELLSGIGKAIITMSAQIEDIDKRFSESSGALKN